MDEPVTKSTRPARRRRVILRAVGVVAVLGIMGWIGLALVLPAIVTRQLAEAFRNAGLEHVEFKLRSATPWQARVTAISAGPDHWLQVGELTIDYSPVDAVNGQIESIRIRDGRLDVPREWLDGTGIGESTLAPLPFERVELESCVLAIHRGPRPFEVALNGTLVRGADGISRLSLAAGLGQSVLNVSGTLDAHSGTTDVTARVTDLAVEPVLALLPAEVQEMIGEAGGAVDARIDHHRQPSSAARTSAVVELKEGFVVGTGADAPEVRGIHAQFTITAFEPFQTLPGQTLTARTVKVAGEQITDVSMKLHAKGTGHVRISDAQFNWADGHVTLEPFEVSRSSSAVALVMSAEHIDVAHMINLISQGRASGTGRLRGRIPLQIDWPRVTFGEGVIESEGGGTIRLGESITAFAKVLDQTDPRFTQDDQMQQVKGQILDALTDFQQEHLRADFKRVDDELVVAVTIQGRGRTGARQPLDITLNFRGFEHGLNTYLAGRSRVLDLGR